MRIRTSPLSAQIHRALLMTIACAALAPQAALAQQANTGTTAQKDKDKATQLDTVVVTGTRILLPNQESPNPITSMEAQDIAYTGKTNVQEVVNEIGALVGSDNDGETSRGESAIILRNLGQNRTLVLLDGQRMVGGFAGSSAVDVNAVPMALIDRVDVLTGGASAIYGADAVTGVVNFVLKRDFEGMAFDARYGDSQQGDFRDQQYSLTFGQAFAGGMGNVTASYTYGERPLVLATARDDASVGMHQQINNLDGKVPRFVLRAGTQEAFFTNGGARIDPFNPTGGFNGDGTPFKHGINVGSFGGTGEIGGDGIPNWMLFAQAIRQSSTRHIATLRGHLDVDPRFMPYVDLHLSKVTNRSLDQGTLTVGASVPRDNAFLPASVLAAIKTPRIQYNRWDLESGYRDGTIEKNTRRLVIGARGDLTDWLRYDISANLGQMDRTETVANNRMYDRYIAAMDAVVDPKTGRVVCRSNLDPASFNGIVKDFLASSFNVGLGPATFTAGPNSGCVPFNPFTKDASVNKDAIAWIWIPTQNWLKNRQAVYNGYVAGDTAQWFNLQGGPMSFVLGGEYRHEQSDYRFDAFSGSSRVVASNAGSDLRGEFDVKEAFAEVSLPIFDDLHAGVRMLKFDAAARYSDYSTIGGTQTWKLGLLWDTFAGFTARASLSSAVRAPNIGELYTPRINTSSALGQRDPCLPANWTLGTSYRAGNCQSMLRGLGMDPAKFDPKLGTFFAAVTGGNPNLQEETARTRTVGLLWNVPWVERLSLSVDYFDIRLDNAVLATTAIAVFNACYDSPTLDNQFCRLIKRDPTSGFATFVEYTPVNVAAMRTSGVEFNLTHLLRTTRFGDWRTSINATRTDRLDIQKSLLPVITDDLGLFDTDLGRSSPRWVANADISWRLGNFDANYGYGFSSATLRNGGNLILNVQRPIADTIIDRPFVKPYRNHDVQVGWRFTPGTRVFAGIGNLTGERPDAIVGHNNGPSGRQGFAGRTWYVGVNSQLDEFFGWAK